MLDWWNGQLDYLQTLAEIFFHVTSAEEGGNKNLSTYQEFRATRLQLRFVQDLVTCIQVFISSSKEKKLNDRDSTATFRHGHMGNYVSDLDYWHIESIAMLRDRFCKRYLKNEALEDGSMVEGANCRRISMSGIKLVSCIGNVQQ